MKVLMLNYEFPPLGGGSSPVTLHLGRELVKRGHQVDLVTMAYKGLPREEEVEGIRVIRIPSLRFRKDKCSTPEMISFVLSAWRRLPEIARQGDYQINHTHFIFPTGLLAASLKRKIDLPFLITSHGSDVPGYNPDRFQLQHKLLLPLWRLVTRRAELITTPSIDHATLVRKNRPGTQVIPIPNGIDTEEFRADRPKKPIILGAGRLFPRKNYATVIKALAGMDPEWELVLIGEGRERPRLEKLARENGVPLRITGWLDRQGPKLKELFETASIFVLPSLKESFGMVVAEAMSAGMAVVTSDTGGPAEVAGEAGILIPPADVNELRNALFMLMDTPNYRAELGRMGKERVRQNFAWPIVATKFEQIYEQIIDNNMG